LIIVINSPIKVNYLGKYLRRRRRRKFICQTKTSYTIQVQTQCNTSPKIIMTGYQRGRSLSMLVTLKIKKVKKKVKIKNKKKLHEIQ